MDTALLLSCSPSPYLPFPLSLSLPPSLPPPFSPLSPGKLCRTHRLFITSWVIAGDSTTLSTSATSLSTSGLRVGATIATASVL